MILCKHQSHICLLTADKPLSFLWGIHSLRDDKVFRLCQSFYGLLCTWRHLGGNHHRAHILHVGGDGKTEEQHHHHRHTEEYQHRTLVAQNVLGFLYYKCYKLFHFSKH